MKLFLFQLFGFVICIAASAQKKDVRLQRQVEALVKQHQGNVGVFVKNLKNGKSVEINADTIYPTASMVKVPILVGIMDKINRGELSYHQEMIYHDSLLYPGVDILGSFKQGEKIELSKLIMLMTSMSDNTASIWVQLLAGTGTRINAIMDSLGLHNTRVNSRTPGREGARSVYGWGQTTPREMATLLERIYQNRIISPAISERMLRSLNRNYWDGEALSQIPPKATMFSKNGALNEYRSEVVLVKGYDSEYVFVVVTNNNKDTSWTKDNEAWVLIRQLSSLLWNYFEPQHQWKPPMKSDMFY